MIRCIIVDDEPLAIRALEYLLSGVPDVEVTATCTRPLDALALIRRTRADVLLLDIEMPGLSGLDVVRSLNDPPHVIFTTAHREHAVDGFDLDAVDYLLKPVSLPRLLRALDKIRQRTTEIELAATPGSKSGVIHVLADRQVRAIRTADIRCAEALGDYVVIHTVSERITTRMTLTGLFEALRPFDFLRVHRSHIVNPAHVERWSATDLTLGDRRVPVGRTYRVAIAAHMDDLRGK